MVSLCIDIMCLAFKHSCLKVLCITPLKAVLLHSCFLVESQFFAVVKYDCKNNFLKIKYNIGVCKPVEFTFKILKCV